MSSIDVLADLRDTLGPVRDQGRRQSCLACAASDAHSAVHLLPHPLSPEYLFFYAATFMPGGQYSNGLTFEATHSALVDFGQPHEEEWPYERVHPNPWIAPVATKVWRGQLEIDYAATAKTIASHVQAGAPVILAVRLNSAFYKVGKPDFIVSPNGPGVAGHAVVVAGLGKDSTNNELFLIRNSWGTDWGLSGHAWLPSEYLTDKLIGFSAIIPKA